MVSKLKILVLIKPFWIYPKHQAKTGIFKELEKLADVYYWYKDGHIHDILKEIKILPDFIFHYDIAWNNALAPNIEGLEKVDIPTGCFVIDLHWKPEKRINYFEDKRIDMIFSATKQPFLKTFPQYENKLHWLPWSINPKIMKDWNRKKDIDSLLMGLVYIDKEDRYKYSLPERLPRKGRYAFRDAVLEKMKNKPGFVFHPHPGHFATETEHLIVNEAYGKKLNRSKIFFTCGSSNPTGGIAVLKFFEAPACNTLLLAETNEDIMELGFINGENYVACTEENLVEKTDYYLANDAERLRITRNGYRFIHKYHTDEQRARQLINEIKSFAKM